MTAEVVRQARDVSDAPARGNAKKKSLDSDGRPTRSDVLMSQPCAIEPKKGVAISAFASLPPDAEETVLLTAARMGNQAAFGALVERDAERIHHMVFRITRNHEDAEDAVQECFKSAFAHFKSFRGQSRFSTWLTRIALNCALMKVRARRRELVPLDDSIESSISVEYQHVLRSSLTPEESYSRKELESTLAEEMARLKPNLKKALHLYLMEELITRDAAKLLGISNAALKSRVRKARLVLRSRLRRRGIGRRPPSNRSETGSTGFDQGGGASGRVIAIRYCPEFGD